MQMYVIFIYLLFYNNIVIIFYNQAMVIDVVHKHLEHRQRMCVRSIV